MTIALASILRDVRHACRTITGMPVLASVVVLSLAIGIGVNTVVFSWIQSTIFRPLPGVANAASFHLVEPRTESGIYTGVSWLEYRDLRERLHSFKDLLAFRMVPLYVGEPGQVERAYGMLVSANYFTTLGLRPALGRFLKPEEVSRPGAEPVTVISYDYWQEHFGADPRVLERTLRVNGRDLAIVGVAPRGFQGTILRLNFDLWLPATLTPVILNGSRDLDDRSSRGYAVMGQLLSNITLEQAQGDLDVTMRELARTYPATNTALRGEVLTFWRAPRGPQRFLAAALGILQAIMLLVLLAVCGNTANLVLARASGRQRELGVRLALGAGPWRVISLLLVENMLMALAGAALGTAIAIWGTQALPNIRLSGLPIRFQTSVDVGGLLFAVVLGIGCGLLFGAAPALQFSKLDPLLALRTGSTMAGRSRMRNALMAIQVGLALVVLVVAGVFLRSFLETREIDPGFRREGILLAAYDLTGRIPANASDAARTFAAQLLERLQQLPSVESTAIASSVPLDIHGLPSRVFTVDGRARTDGGFDQAVANTVTPGYFATMGLELCAGSDFVDLQDRAAPAQAVVNEEFVRRYLANPDPASALGRNLQSRGGRFVIVGVVRNSLYNAFGEPPLPAIYFSYRDRPTPGGEVHLRTRVGSETRLAPDVRRIVSELDADLPVYNVRTLSEHIENNLLFRRIPARMFTVLGPLLLLLAAIGIYAVVAYTVSHRTTEIGVRLALGATANKVVGQFVGQSLTIIGLGALAGWLLAFVVALDFVPGGKVDGPVFVAVPAILLAVASVSCWLPARRATRIEPMAALRRD